MSVNSKIKSLREHKLGISISEMARRCGVTRSAVQQWEREDGSAPSRAHLDRVCAVLKVTKGELLGDSPIAQARTPADLSPRAYRVGQMFDRITDLQARMAFYALLVVQSGWDEATNPLPIEEDELLHAPKPARASKR